MVRPTTPVPRAARPLAVRTSTSRCRRAPAAGKPTTRSMSARFLLAPLATVRHYIDMADSVEAHAPILAAGGIVLREGSRPRIAIVRLRREKAWVLPKGKLYPGERPHVAAKREVLEETGPEVSLQQCLDSE